MVNSQTSLCNSQAENRSECAQDEKYLKVSKEPAGGCQKSCREMSNDWLLTKKVLRTLLIPAFLRVLSIFYWRSHISYIISYILQELNKIQNQQMATRSRLNLYQPRSPYSVGGTTSCRHTKDVCIFEPAGMVEYSLPVCTALLSKHSLFAQSQWALKQTKHCKSIIHNDMLFDHLDWVCNSQALFVPRCFVKSSKVMTT